MKRKRKRMQRPARTFETTEDKNDPIQQLIEWQEHRYDPGYYTGGNFHPLVTASRPSRYGYVLIIGATMTLLALVLGIRADAIDWYSATVLTALTLFLFAVGFKLVKKSTSKAGLGHNRRRPSKFDD